MDFADFPVGFGVWEGLQSMGNGCGLQIDGFSAHFKPYEFIFDDFHDFGDFAAVFSGLKQFRDCPEGSGTPSEGSGALGECVIVV